jgi:antibiotic biosynthesis monooxygenase (ABM) superfamily enzyme
MNTPHNRNVVTLVIQHKVRAQALAPYEAWLKRAVSTARQQPGHLDVNVIRPDDGGRQFTTIVRFADASLLQAWVNSAERQALVSEVLPLLEEATRPRCMTIRSSGSPRPAPAPRHRRAGSRPC